MLAEVSDKIPSVGVFWCIHLVVAAAMLLLSLASKRRVVLLAALPLTLTWAAFFVYQALLGDAFLRADILAEMGSSYYINQGVAAIMPAVAVVVRLVGGRRRKQEGRRGFEVDLTGAAHQPSEVRARGVAVI